MIREIKHLIGANNPKKTENLPKNPNLKSSLSQFQNGIHRLTKFKNVYVFFQDCTACSLSKLSLHELLSKAEIDEHCLSVARELFRQNYGSTKFHLSGPFQSDETNAIDETNQQHIYIQNIRLVKMLLKWFGDLIRKLDISFENIDGCPGREIIENVNKNCSESLVRLEMRNCKEFVLDNLKNTFPHMRTALFSSSQSKSLQITPDAVKLNQLFPNLESLMLEYTKKSDWELIGTQFPNLTMLAVELPNGKDPDRPDGVYVGNWLKSNPKIEILSIQHCTMNILKAANELLLNLKNLELRFFSTEYLNYEGDPIHFNNVRQLTIHSNRSKDEVPEFIFFDQLQDLKLYVKPELTDKWTSFIGQQFNKNSIIKLVISTNVLTKARFNALSDLLPNLNGVSIDCSTDYTAKDIIKFIEKSNQLMTLRMKVPMEVMEERILRSKLQNKWHYKMHSEGDKIHMVFSR